MALTRSNVAHAWIGLLLACGAPGAAWSSGVVDQGQEPARDAETQKRDVELSLTSRVFGNTRLIRVHLPPGYFHPLCEEDTFPVLYLNDGSSVFSNRQWNAPSIVDRLIEDEKIPPLILVGIDNAASIPGASNPERDRANEFLPYPDATEPDLPSPAGAKYPEFVVDEVMPLVASHFRVRTEAVDTAIGGASYGGIAALNTVLLKPGVFGKLLLESTPLFLFEERMVAESGRLETWPQAVYVGIGTRETEDKHILELGDRAIHSFVEGSQKRPGTRTLLNQVDGAGHNAAAWSKRLPSALEFLFGVD